jgi:hypothetical protein
MIVMPTQLERFDAQALAFEIFARWTFDIPPRDLDELADAVLAWTDEPELEAVVSRAVAQVLGPELEQDLRESLEELAEAAPACRRSAQSALSDLGLRRDRSDIVCAFVLQCATQQAHDDLPLMFCLCCVEEGLAHGGDFDSALTVARVAVRDVDIPEDELAAALHRCMPDPRRLPPLLATDARRAAMRGRIGRIAALGRRSLPILSGLLCEAVSQSELAGSADDKLWAALCRELARDIASPELN